jgi:phospholipid/cholesterol/gamma-HCH transport system substrate-binding protein
MARRNPIEILTGILVLIVAGGFLAYAVSNSGTSSVTNGYPIYASFDSIAGLGPGSDVRIAGVTVGSVVSETVDPKTYLARVKMLIEPGIRLPKDSGVTVSTESLLGGEYLSISPGGDTQMLQPGGQITTTQGAVSLQDLLGRFIFSATNMVNAMTSQSGKPGSPAHAGGASGGAAPAGNGAGGSLSGGGAK